MAEKQLLADPTTPADFCGAQLGKDGTVILALTTLDGVQAFELSLDNASSAAVELLSAASSAPIDPLAHTVSEVRAVVAGKAALVLEVKIGDGFQLLSFQRAEVSALKQIFHQMSELNRPPAPNLH